MTVLFVNTRPIVLNGRREPTFHILVTLNVVENGALVVISQLWWSRCRQYYTPVVVVVVVVLCLIVIIDISWKRKWLALLIATWRGIWRYSSCCSSSYCLCLAVDLVLICEAARCKFLVEKFKVMTFTCLIRSAEASSTVWIRLYGRCLLQMSCWIEHYLLLCNRFLVTDISSGPLLLILDDDLRGLHNGAGSSIFITI